MDALAPPVPSSAEPLVRDQAYQEDPLHRKRIEWVKSRKGEYYDSSAFKNYKRRTERIKYMVNQAWEPGKKSGKFGFRFAIARAVRDNYNYAFTDLFDLDEFLSFTPLKANTENQAMSEHLQDYANNLLQSIDYKRTWWDRLRYLPDYGWSPAYTDYVYQLGWKPKVKVAPQTIGGFTWEREWDVLKNEPRSMVLHPYNWFGNPQASLNHDRQGYTVRWHIADLEAAKLKVDDKNRPLYNHAALDLLIAKLKKGESVSDSYFTVAGDRDIVTTSTASSDKLNSIPYVDITVYNGVLQGCEGHEDDGTTYIMETCGEYMLRFAEDTMAGMFPWMTHARTHPFRNSPFSQSFLDAVVPHQSINDLLINIAIENQIDGMHRMWAYYADDLLDENELKHPRGPSSFLELKDRNAFLPRLVGDIRSGSLQDLDVLHKAFLEPDRQRAGVSDQEIGIPGNGQGDTATQANILKSASSKTIRSTAKCISNDALVPECRSLVFLSLIHSSPEQKRILSRDGQVVQLTPEHAQLFLTGLDARINDNVTRDRWEEASRKAAFWGNAFKILQGLTQPQYAIRMLRQSAKDAGFKKDEIDAVLPEPQIPEVGQPSPAGPPGATGASFPPGQAVTPGQPPAPAIPPPAIGAPNVALEEAQPA